MLKDKVVWITGASKGIGKALAIELSREGARVILSARSIDELKAVQSQCKNPERHFVLPMDVKAQGEFHALVDKAVDKMGRLDVLVNNAGISNRSLGAETKLEVDREIMEVNYFGPVALTKAVLPVMQRQGAGQIVVVSSLLGKLGAPTRTSYAASKHAVHGFFDSLRAEIANQGIGVTLVCPGFVKTEISFSSLNADGSRFGKMDPNQAGGMDARVCARKLMRAIERRRNEVIIARWEGVAVALKRFAPWLLTRLLNTYALKIMRRQAKS